MKSSDLRIGNYVLANAKITKVTDVLESGINQMRYDVEYDSEDLEPIELTEEILLKCGFVGNEVAYKLENDKFILKLYYYDCWNLTYIEKDKFGNGSVELQGYWNLHQLQNIYYALCNEELNVQL